MLRLYVDDALLYSTIDSPADCMTLQTDLPAVQKWTEVWHMQFNSAKCEHLQITILSIYTTHYMAILYKKSLMLNI